MLGLSLLQQAITTFKPVLLFVGLGRTSPDHDPLPEYVIPVTALTFADTRSIVVVAAVNIRKTATQNSSLVGSFAPGAIVTVQGDVIGGYVRLVGVAGWVLAINLK